MNFLEAVFNTTSGGKHKSDFKIINKDWLKEDIEGLWFVEVAQYNNKGLVFMDENGLLFDINQFSSLPDEWIKYDKNIFNNIPRSEIIENIDKYSISKLTLLKDYLGISLEDEDHFQPIKIQREIMEILKGG